MAKGKDKLEALSKEFESFQTTSMESNRPIMSLMQDMFEGKATCNALYCETVFRDLRKSLRSLPIR